MYNEGPSLVIAGAGSGKTRVLTYKVAYLMHIGLQPEQILALTFTNKAANEMKSRIAAMVDGNKASRLFMGTFHSIFSRILRTEAESIGIQPNYTVYDTDDSKRLIKNIVKEMQLDDTAYRPGVVLGRISKAKNNLIMAEAYGDSPFTSEDYLQQIPRVHEIYSQYAARCKQANALDFDDMLLLTWRLLTECPDVREKYQEAFQYILVDEYQDTNRVQAQIVQLLAKKHHRVCVVGDDAQSIYSFRGANIDNILQFRKIYPESKLFKLERNYRSTKNIVAAAGSLIKHNRNQISKQVYSERETGDPVRLSGTINDLEEAQLVARRLYKLHAEKAFSYNEMAVLYRNNSQSRLIEDACRERNIPYCIHGGVSFYQRKEIKDVLAYLRLILNPSDEEAFRRIVNYPARGIGDVSVKKLSEAASAYGKSLFEVASSPLDFGLQLQGAAVNKLRAFVEMIVEFQEQCRRTDVYEFVRNVVVKSGIDRELRSEDSPENESALQNIDEMLTMVYQYVENKKEEGLEEISLAQFLNDASLMTDADSDNEEDGMERVRLMTIHAAKGLEYKVVMIVGLEEELLPSSMSSTSEDIEEERRLLYVAITRAEELCFMTYAKQRFRYGKPCFPTVSRFVDDIDSQYLLQSGGQSTRPKVDFSRRDFNFFAPKPSTSGVSIPKPQSPVTGKRLVKVRTQAAASREAAAKAGDLQVGMRIRHATFGEGVVVELDRESPSPRVKVNFDTLGEKVLLLQFAKIERL